MIRAIFTFLVMTAGSVVAQISYTGGAYSHEQHA
jgi:hypothetical protein